MTAKFCCCLLRQCSVRALEVCLLWTDGLGAWYLMLWRCTFSSVYGAHDERRSFVQQPKEKTRVGFSLSCWLTLVYIRQWRVFRMEHIMLHYELRRIWQTKIWVTETGSCSYNCRPYTSINSTSYFLFQKGWMRNKKAKFIFFSVLQEKHIKQGPCRHDPIMFTLKFRCRHDYAEGCMRGTVRLVSLSRNSLLTWAVKMTREFSIDRWKWKF